MTAAEWRRQQGVGRVKSAKGVMAGSRAQQSGLTFETCLNQAHEYYEGRGVLAMEQLPVPTRPLPANQLREGSTFRGTARILSSPASCDYFGAFGKIPPDLGPWFLRGKLVMMEAKFSASATKKSLEIHKDHGLRPHQLQRLSNLAQGFGVVSVIVANIGGTRGVLLPDAIIDANMAYLTAKRKSIPLSAFTPYERANGGHIGIIEDWLTPVLAWCKHTMGTRGD
jgi:penicillin-binding protein-related factor A (putative recombinase)